MASNFAFQAWGRSIAVTVGGAAPATVSLNVITLGNVTQTIVPSSIRIVNDGTAAVFLQFGESAATVSLTTSNGMKMLANSVETFGIKGAPFFAAACASTFTVTLGVSVGEGL